MKSKVCRGRSSGDGVKPLVINEKQPRMTYDPKTEVEGVELPSRTYHPTVDPDGARRPVSDGRRMTSCLSYMYKARPKRLTSGY